MRQLLGNVCLVPLVALSPAWLDIFTGVLRRLRQNSPPPANPWYSDTGSLFWSFHWVDDIVLVEVNVDDRLQKAQKHLRDGVKLSVRLRWLA
ncbi:hypothetical protein PR001_g17857 [Phytophthora rubi]|uniref:Uncharacterized protein n=1 Tax=Phytophthora rubi TaxID=129364 RepID=A0A6A3K8Q2_9STRA|nr:hypothetical protein PR001_g17857 [Phytophthora rubi]